MIRSKVVFIEDNERMVFVEMTKFMTLAFLALIIFSLPVTAFAEGRGTYLFICNNGQMVERGTTNPTKADLALASCLTNQIKPVKSW